MNNQLAITLEVLLRKLQGLRPIAIGASAIPNPQLIINNE